MRMRRIIFLCLCSVFLATTAMAVGMDKPRPIEAVLTDIRADLGIKAADTIDVSLVRLSRLEELGDSVMEATIANTALHAQMDKNMGGDGSASLTLMHQRIGYSYLIGYPNSPLGMMSMMGGLAVPGYAAQGVGMMGYNAGYGMMGGFGWMGMVFGLLIIALLVVVAIMAIRHFSRHEAHHLGMHGGADRDTPETILKKRYAKGEITKEEFDRIRKDL